MRPLKCSRPRSTLPARNIRSSGSNLPPPPPLAKLSLTIPTTALVQTLNSQLGQKTRRDHAPARTPNANPKTQTKTTPRNSLDINECEIPSLRALCSDNSECVNLPGHFVCKCKPGYQQAGLSQSTLTGECVRVRMRASAIASSQRALIALAPRHSRADTRRLAAVVTIPACPRFKLK